MISMVSLWIPIVLSAVVVFILSSLIHTVLRYHANDLRKLPDEDAVANALRQWNVPAGEYILPRPNSMKDMNTPEFQEKVKRGPGALLTVWGGGRPSMTASLIQWFLYCLVASIFAAYVSSRALPAVSFRLPVRRSDGILLLCHRRVAGFHLVQTGLVDQPEEHTRRSDLRALHCRDVRLALAAVGRHLIDPESHVCNAPEIRMWYQEREPGERTFPELTLAAESASSSPRTIGFYGRKKIKSWHRS